jgi:hypothetical protein
MDISNLISIAFLLFNSNLSLLSLNTLTILVLHNLQFYFSSILFLKY